MKRKCLVFMCVILYFVSFTNSAYAFKNEANIYFNGEEIDISYVIRENTIFLPLRSVFSQFFTDVELQNETKTIIADIDTSQLQLTINNNFAILKSKNTNGSSTVPLEYPASIENNTTYVPFRFIANLFHANINWDNETKSAYIEYPLQYKNGQWYYKETDIALPIEESSAIYQKDEDNYYIIIYKEALMTTSYLYQLTKDGKANYIYSDLAIRDFKIKNDNCYLIVGSTTIPMNHFIYKIELKNPQNIVPLGDRNFNYNMPIIVDKVENDEYYIGFGTVKNPLSYTSWEIREDGIYALGYNRNALEPESTLIKDIKLLRNTYGYYLIDTDEPKHVKVESIDIEYR